MRRFRHPLAATIALLVAIGCSSPLSGPVASIRPRDLDASLAPDSIGARATALAFIQAYAETPADGPDRLAALIATPTLKLWTHWLGVQDQEFPGTADGSAHIADIGTVMPADFAKDVPGAELYRDVEVDAQERFAFTPDRGKAFDVVRALNGPIRMVQGRPGQWRVVDFIRDGVPMSATFQAIEDVVVNAGPTLAVQLDSFLAYPLWQFDLVVAATEPYRLPIAGVSLVDGDGKTVAEPGTVTRSLLAPEVDTPAEGIATFPLQTSDRGLVLQLRFQGPQGTSIVRFPLEDVIDPIPVATGPSASASATPSP